MTEEMVLSVTNRGQVIVGGRVGGGVLRTVGSGRVEAGQEVTVLWQGGKAIACMKGRVRKSKPVINIPKKGAVVEVLFIDDETGEVYYQNDKQTTSLDVLRDMDSLTMAVRWGVDGDSFVVVTHKWTCYVYELTRQVETQHPGPNEPIGPNEPTATLIRRETPLHNGLVLVNRHIKYSLTGETRYFAQSNYVSGEPNTLFEGEVAAEPISWDMGRDDGVKLSELEVMGDSEYGINRPPGVADKKLYRPTIHVLEMALDARRHLIWTLSVDTSSAQMTARNSEGNYGTRSKMVRDYRVNPVTLVNGQQYDDPQYLDVYRLSESHLIVANVTTRQFLYRSCKEKISTETHAECHRFHTVGPWPTNDPAYNAYYGMSGNAEWGVQRRSSDTNDQVFQGWEAGSGTQPASLTYDFPSGWMTPGYNFGIPSGSPWWAGVVNVMHDEYANHSYIDDSGDLVGSVNFAPQDMTRGLCWRLHPIGVPVTTPHWVKVTHHPREWWQKTRYKFSGVYIPRPPTATPDEPYKKGWLFVTVTRIKKDPPYIKSPTGGPPNWPYDDKLEQGAERIETGLFLHDLSNDFITELCPIENNAGHGNMMGWPFIGTKYYPWGGHGSLTYVQAFTILGWDGESVLWLQRYAPRSLTNPNITTDSKARMYLTHVPTKTKKLVYEGRMDAQIPHWFNGSGFDPQVQKLVDMNLQLLQPGVMFYSKVKAVNEWTDHEEGGPGIQPVVYPPDEENGDKFIDAWGEKRTPTLDANAPDFPPPQDELEGLAELNDIPQEVEMRGRTWVVNGMGPLNLVFSETGPQYRVVTTPKIIEAGNPEPQTGG
jgi:hypothetical protein